MNILGTLAALVISLFGLQQAPPAALGTAVPLAPALYDGYLASGITSSDTSMTLSTGTLRNGQSLSGFMCFTVDNGQPTTEYICGTASSTAVTSLTRGVDVLNPNSSSTSYAYSHRRFASVQISDYPTLQFLVRKANGTDQYDTKLQYSFTSTSTFTGAGDIISKAYADSLSYAGAPDANTTTKGLVEIGSASEIASSTATGGTGAIIVPPGNLYSGSATSTTVVPVTRSSGKLGQWFLDLTEAFSWSGAHTFTGAATHNATTTLASSTIISSVASSSVIVSGGSGAAISGVAPSSSGAFLQSNGSSWYAGFPAPTTAAPGNVTLTNNTTTLVLTISGHRAGATVVANCGAQMTTNNATVVFTLSSSGTGTMPSCSLGSGTGNPGGCALNAIVTNTTATSTTFSIQNSNASNNGVGHCIAHTIN